MSSGFDISGNKQLTTQERDQIPVHNKSLDGITIFNKDTNRLERLRDRLWEPLIGDAQSFAGLSDTPTGFPAGSAGKPVIVNASENGVTFQLVGSTNTFIKQIGNASDTEFTITHTLDTKYVQVSILEAATDHKVEADVHITAHNTVTVKFSLPPNVNEFMVVITK